ncbi:Bromodomain-containing protein [Dacryopinax primogenitus]|uniref:Bromodomain-containing protein n=1 Tax=Dacryopinax primogenitus (strain DJM 731) TaxID=1858805 RepID=M5G569_DACPD|nr:Bromodomain-containing protein [Dacryopinax primogenitus]EJT98902.1 Bromodomain-containing protein [Dacryopinax primogenitus]
MEAASVSAPPLVPAPAPASAASPGSAPPHMNGIHPPLELSALPLPTPKSSLDAVSIIPEIHTPQDPNSIPVPPPKGTPPPPTGQLLDDVQMAEAGEGKGEEEDNVEQMLGASELSSQTLLPHQAHDVSGMKRSAEEMEDVKVAVVPEIVGINAVVSPVEDAMDVETPKAELVVDGASQVGRQENGEPLSKRQRLTPTPDLRIHTNGLHPRVSTFSAAQHKYAAATIRQLKKNRDAAPFLKPVDTVGLNIPHYHNVIKHPMDLGTVEEKLALSNPAVKSKQSGSATESDPSKRYWTADEFVADVRLIVDNAIKFNGEAHVVSQMAKRLLEIFDKQAERMPPAEEPKPVLPAAQSAPIIPSHPSPPIPNSAHPVPPKQQRRQSIAVPVIRRNSPETPTAVVRPKREIHPPPSRDLPYIEAVPGKKRRSGKGKGRERDDGTQEQLKFCASVLQHLFKKSYYSAAYPFYDPVDYVALNIPDYPKIIKKPMDLSTMKKKLESKTYENAQEFHADFKLMIKNCRLYNPAQSPVREAGEELNRIFDEKWKGLPPLYQLEEEEEEDEEEDEDEEGVDMAMAGVQAQVARLVKTLEQLQKQKADKTAKKKAVPAVPKEDSKPKASKPRKPKPSGSAGTPTAGPSKPRKRKDKDEESDEDGPVDFFKKRELAEEIPKLEGEALTEALALIQEGMSSENPTGPDDEIELDIDILAPSVIRRLYRMVVEPAKKKREAEEKRKMRASGVAVGGGRAGGNAGKGASGRKGHPTGGLKRKSMDEAAEAEKIRMLEERLSMFNGSGAPADVHQAQGQVMDVDESVSTEDESSSDDDSGSE